MEIMWNAVRNYSIEKNKLQTFNHLTIGYVFYQLHLTLSITKLVKFKYISVTTRGDLIGNGSFIFEKKGQQITRLTYIWNVETTKPWMILLSSIAHPIFIRSHNFVMHQFIKGLANKLSAQILEEKYT